jgi:hypothetical protein
MMNIESVVKRVIEICRGESSLGFFLRCFFISSLLLLSLASFALFRMIATQSNPFFYANF